MEFIIDDKEDVFVYNKKPLKTEDELKIERDELNSNIPK